MHEKYDMPDTSNIPSAACTYLKLNKMMFTYDCTPLPIRDVAQKDIEQLTKLFNDQIINNMKGEYGCGYPVEPVVLENANTFDGFVKHFYPRQVVKLQLCPAQKPKSATVRKVHIDDKNEITYDLEVWAWGGKIIKDVTADCVFINNLDQ